MELLRIKAKISQLIIKHNVHYLLVTFVKFPQYPSITLWSKFHAFLAVFWLHTPVGLSSGKDFAAKKVWVDLVSAKLNISEAKCHCDCISRPSFGPETQISRLGCIYLPTDGLSFAVHHISILTGTHWTRGWVDIIAGFSAATGEEKNIFPCLESNSFRLALL
jgi:hypothetical protein